jgi:hypothetical protein
MPPRHRPLTHPTPWTTSAFDPGPRPSTQPSLIPNSVHSHARSSSAMALLGAGKGDGARRGRRCCSAAMAKEAELKEMRVRLSRQTTAALIDCHGGGRGARRGRRRCSAGKGRRCCLATMAEEARASVGSLPNYCISRSATPTNPKMDSGLDQPLGSCTRMTCGIKLCLASLDNKNNVCD